MAADQVLYLTARSDLSNVHVAVAQVLYLTARSDLSDSSPQSKKKHLVRFSFDSARHVTKYLHVVMCLFRFV